MAKVIGIDLGTTNSCMAVLEGGEPTVIPNAEGGRTTPSVVGFAKDGQRLVGTPAKRQAVTNPQNTIFSIKRFMGRKHSEVSEEMKIVPYEVSAGPNGDVRVDAAGKQYSPPEISAMILQKLKADAEVSLRVGLQLLKDHRRDLGWRELLPVDRSYDLLRRRSMPAGTSYGTIFISSLTSRHTPHEPLDREDRALGVRDRLALRRRADQTLPVLGERDHGRRGPPALGVRDDRRLAAFEHGHPSSSFRDRCR